MNPASERCADCGAFVDPQLRLHDCLYAHLRAAVPAGLDLTEREDRWLRWLAGFDRDAAEPLISLFVRLRAADRALTDTLLEALRKASPETLHAGIDALIEELNEPFCVCGRHRSQCDGSRVGCVSRLRVEPVETRAALHPGEQRCGAPVPPWSVTCDLVLGHDGPHAWFTNASGKGVGRG